MASIPGIDALSRRPAPEPLRALLNAYRGLRRYPVIPLTIVLAVMVVPAIFAPLIAPHPPKKGYLQARLAPPVWVGPEISAMEVVNEIDRVNYRPQILVGDAERMLAAGNARMMNGAAAAQVGEKLVGLTTVVEEPPPGGAPGIISLKDAASAVERGRMQVTGGGPLLVGGQVEELTSRGGTWSYLLGTDKVGRDILSRIIYGSRISIVVAVIAIALAGTIGTALGISAGFFGRWLDATVMRLVDVSLSIPIILVALVLATALGASFSTVIAVLVLLLWAHYARMARGVTLSIRSADFIARSRVAGASNARIMVRHILPNVFNSLVVLATLQVGFVIVIESTLSFLGAGIPRPNPAWGLMVADGRELIVSHWWVAFFPGLAIMLVVLSFNLMGDWLRDRLDPKQRQV